MNAIKIAPSLLAADFSRLGAEIERVEKAGCDMLHLDVMDGHFVPNLTIGPIIVRAIRKLTKLPLDTHLMIDTPSKYIPEFVKAGSDSITVHAEACPDDLGRTVALIRSYKVGCGVSLKPASPLSMLEEVLGEIDLVLMMTVNPGFGGQAFMPEVLPKVRELRAKFKKDIQVDGGINKDTCQEAVRSGANVLVAGTAIFGAPDAAAAIRQMRG